MNDLYKVIKIEVKTEIENDYGIYNYDDMKAITKGYKDNGLFYERENGKYIFIVTKQAD